MFVVLGGTGESAQPGNQLLIEALSVDRKVCAMAIGPVRVGVLTILVCDRWMCLHRFNPPSSPGSGD